MGFFRFRTGTELVGSVRTQANCMPGSGMGGFGGGGLGAGPYGGSSLSGAGSNYNINRFNPVYDRLEEASIVDDWIPKDASGLNKMFRLLYIRDAIIGSAIDLYKNLPFSEFKLLGIDDPAILQIYQDCVDSLSVMESLPEMAGEMLVTGKVCTSMVFDQTKGYWTDFITHDPDFLSLTPIPIKGVDPKIDLIPSPGMRQFIHSTDPRDMEAREKLPESFLRAFALGRVPLDPLNTLYIPRRANPYDHLGTSFLTRCVVFWALEKALINATVASARRRSRSILHVKAGIDGTWEPTADEMNSIASLFIQADEDPVGAVVITRTGVDASEVRDGTAFWKLSDEWQFLTEGKMRALGISDAFLSGDATYNNMEQALSVFIEQLRAFRTHFTNKVFYQKLFPTLARVHGFVKRSKAELDHNIRIGPTSMKNMTPHEALKIPANQLIMPEISWHKQLRPEADMNYLEILQRMEEKGIPIALRTWAAAGGVDLDKQMDMQEDDIALRLKIKRERSKLESNEGAEDNLALSQTKAESRVSNIPIWDRKRRCGDLTMTEAENFLKDIKDKKSENVLESAKYFFNNDRKKVQAACYVAYRSGVPVETKIDQDVQKEIIRNVINCSNNKKRWQEFNVLSRVVTNKAEDTEFKQVERKSGVHDKIASNSPNLLAGV